jgi:hypothetical protein
MFISCSNVACWLHVITALGLAGNVPAVFLQAPACSEPFISCEEFMLLRFPSLDAIHSFISASHGQQHSEHSRMRLHHDRIDLCSHSSELSSATPPHLVTCRFSP